LLLNEEDTVCRDNIDMPQAQSITAVAAITIVKDLTNRR